MCNSRVKTFHLQVPIGWMIVFFRRLSLPESKFGSTSFPGEMSFHGTLRQEAIACSACRISKRSGNLVPGDQSQCQGKSLRQRQPEHDMQAGRRVGTGRRSCHPSVGRGERPNQGGHDYGQRQHQRYPDGQGPKQRPQVRRELCARSAHRQGSHGTPRQKNLYQIASRLKVPISAIEVTLPKLHLS
jgi:hypothetical protein